VYAAAKGLDTAIVETNSFCCCNQHGSLYTPHGDTTGNVEDLLLLIDRNGLELKSAIIFCINTILLPIYKGNYKGILNGEDL
jgi:hypothetical protein